MARAGNRTRLLLLRHPIVVGLALVIGVGMLIAFAAAQWAFFLAFVGVLLGCLMSFPVGWLARWMARGPAVLLTLLAMLGLATGVGFLTVPRLIDDGRQVSEQVSVAAGRLDAWIGAGAQQQGEPGIESTLREHVDDWIGIAMETLVPTTLTFVECLFGIVIAVVLAAFLVYRPDAYRGGLRALMPRPWERRFDQIWDELGFQLRHWIGGTLVSMAIMGTLAGVGLLIAGIHSWLLLGVLTFFGTFVPYAGAIASAIPGLILALAQSPIHLAYALAVYLGVHITEGYVVQPLIMRRAVKLKPGMLLFWELLMGGAFGVLGVVVATPLLVVVQVLTQRLYVEAYLGKRPGDA